MENPPFIVCFLYFLASIYRWCSHGFPIQTSISFEDFPAMFDTGGYNPGLVLRPLRPGLCMQGLQGIFLSCPFRPDPGDPQICLIQPKQHKEGSLEPRQKPISFAMSLGYAYAGACALLTRTQCYLMREQ